MTASLEPEYRLARLQQRLAAGEIAELGIRAEFRAGTVLIKASVPTADCRERLLTAVAEELGGVPVHLDIAVTDHSAPVGAEDIR
ncbi:BON domain-containing protein [Kitasatospora sp. CMC57]|uniref:BON domain-containing protein n=1 Tax=Kitasatospora sp. CMC57 TaxID=3231513 RepID=A0AB33K648_9ACTN